MQTRYVAEWITAQHNYPGSDDWNPDADEREERTYKSLAAAQKGGAMAARKAGVFPWVRVEEQRAARGADELGDFTRWEVVRAWVSDYDGEVWDEIAY